MHHPEVLPPTSIEDKAKVRTFWWEIVLDFFWIALMIHMVMFLIAEEYHLPPKIPTDYKNGIVAAYVSKWVIFLWPLITLWVGVGLTLGAYNIQIDYKPSMNRELWVKNIVIIRVIMRVLRTSLQILFFFLMDYQISYAENSETKFNWNFTWIFVILNSVIAAFFGYSIYQIKLLQKNAIKNMKQT